MSLHATIEFSKPCVGTLCLHKSVFVLKSRAAISQWRSRDRLSVRSVSGAMPKYATFPSGETHKPFRKVLGVDGSFHKTWGF